MTLYLSALAYLTGNHGFTGSNNGKRWEPCWGSKKGDKTRETRPKAACLKIFVEIRIESRLERRQVKTPTKTDRSPRQVARKTLVRCASGETHFWELSAFRLPRFEKEQAGPALTSGLSRILDSLAYRALVVQYCI